MDSGTMIAKPGLRWTTVPPWPVVQGKFRTWAENRNLAVPQRRDTEREGWEPDQVLPERARQRTVAGKAHRVAPLQETTR